MVGVGGCWPVLARRYACISCKGAKGEAKKRTFTALHPDILAQLSSAFRLQRDMFVVRRKVCIEKDLLRLVNALTMRCGFEFMEKALLAADYSQIELRVIAAMSQEETMIEAFKNGEDIHASTAAKVFNVPLDEVTREQRGNAKTVNFGIIYGVSAFGLSNQTDLSRTEAKELIETYYETYPKLRKYMSSQVDFARDHGYVTTLSNRRRYLKDINSRNAIVRGAAERNAVNAPIQA